MFWVKLITEIKKKNDYFMVFVAPHNFLLSLQKKYLFLYQKQRILFMKRKSNKSLSSLLLKLECRDSDSIFKSVHTQPYSKSTCTKETIVVFFLYFTQTLPHSSNI